MYRASLVAQTAKNRPGAWETQVQSLGQEDPLEKEMATSVFLPEEFHRWRSLAGYSPWGCKESDTTEPLHFSNYEPVCCSISGSNCCFLTCTQLSQEAGKVVWNFHLFKYFPQLVVTHRIKGLNAVNETKEDIFLECSWFFFMIQQILAIWSLVPLPFLNSACASGSSQFTYCWSLTWRILSFTMLALYSVLIFYPSFK